jgi:hypothetical protein
MIFSYIIWVSIAYLPMMTISVFNASLGILLLDVQGFLNSFRFSGPYFWVLFILVITSFFISLPILMLLGMCIFYGVYLANSKKGKKGFELVSDIDFYVEPYGHQNSDKDKGCRAEKDNSLRGSDPNVLFFCC